MPQDIINKFKHEYGDKAGEKIYYATANKQGRDPETFKAEESLSDEQLEQAIQETMNSLTGVIADPNAPETPAPLGSTDQPTMGLPGVPSVTPVSCEPTGTGITPPGAIVDVPKDPLANPTGMEISLEPTPPIEEASLMPPASSNLPPVGNFPPASHPIPPLGTLTGNEKSPASPGIVKETLMEKNDKKEEKKNKAKEGGKFLPRKGNKHMPKGKQIHKTKKDKEENPKHKDKWEKFDESVNLYISKTSRNCDIGVSSLEKIWKECVEVQAKGTHPRSSRKFWLEVRSKFDKKVNDIFIEEAKKTMTERQKLSAAVERFIEHVAQDRYVEAKNVVKEMAEACTNSMISDRKVQYQKTLAEEIAKKVREAK